MLVAIVWMPVIVFKVAFAVVVTVIVALLDIVATGDSRLIVLMHGAHQIRNKLHLIILLRTVAAVASACSKYKKQPHRYTDTKRRCRYTRTEGAGKCMCVCECVL